MRHVTCLLTPARALHRALLLELANATYASTSKGWGKDKDVRTTALISSSSSTRRHTPSLPTSNPSRTLPQATTFITTTTANATPCSVYVRSFSASAAQRGPPRKLARNNEIPYQWVRVADEDGQLSPPARKTSIISELPVGYALVMVAPPSKRDADEGVEPAAICRMVNEAARTAAQKTADEEAEKESKRLARQTKILELNWAIAPHDLIHRLKNFRSFLAKGLRVEVMLARKRGSRKASEEEARGLYERIGEVASEQGASEYKNQDGKVGGTMRLFYQGIKRKADKTTLADEEEVNGE